MGLPVKDTIPHETIGDPVFRHPWHGRDLASLLTGGEREPSDQSRRET